MKKKKKVTNIHALPIRVDIKRPYDCSHINISFFFPLSYIFFYRRCLYLLSALELNLCLQNIYVVIIHKGQARVYFLYFIRLPHLCDVRTLSENVRYILLIRLLFVLFEKKDTA